MNYLFEQNPVANARLSNPNLDKFSSTHLQSLTANKPVTQDTLYGVLITTVFDTMITNTQLIFDAWKNSVGLTATEKAEKEGKTISVNKSEKDMKDFIRIKKGVIEDKYQDSPDVKEEFYPNGLSEYTTASKKEADIIFKRFISALNTHKDDFDPAVVTEGNDKYNNYVESRNIQLQKIGKVKDGRSDTNDKRAGLEQQLYENILTIVLMNAKNPSKTAIYFDLSLLKKKSKKAIAVEDAAVAK